MKTAPAVLGKETPLRCFVRRAYHDLVILSNTVWSRDVDAGQGAYAIRQAAGGRWVRPINTGLFIKEPDEYEQVAVSCLRLLCLLKRCGADPDQREGILSSSRAAQGEFGQKELDRFLYTTVQATGCVYDLSNPNAQRLFGLLYQSFVHAVVRYLGFGTDSLNISVPEGYWDLSAIPVPEARIALKQVEVDMVIGPVGQGIRTTQYSVWPEDSFATIKSSTKDRISQVFIDAVNIQRLSVWRIARYLLFVHNDVQRTSDNGISWTFLPTNFAEGSKTFPLSGIYFSDMPGNVIARKAGQEEWARLCRYLSEFLVRDIWI